MSYPWGSHITSLSDVYRFVEKTGLRLSCEGDVALRKRADELSRMARDPYALAEAQIALQNEIQKMGNEACLYTPRFAEECLRETILVTEGRWYISLDFSNLGEDLTALGSRLATRSLRNLLVETTGMPSILVSHTMGFSGQDEKAHSELIVGCHLYALFEVAYLSSGSHEPIRRRENGADGTTLAVSGKRKAPGTSRNGFRRPIICPKPGQRTSAPKLTDLGLSEMLHVEKGPSKVYLSRKMSFSQSTFLCGPNTRAILKEIYVTAVIPVSMNSVRVVRILVENVPLCSRMHDGDEEYLFYGEDALKKFSEALLEELGAAAITKSNDLIRSISPVRLATDEIGWVSYSTFAAYMGDGFIHNAFLVHAPIRVHRPKFPESSLAPVYDRTYWPRAFGEYHIWPYNVRTFFHRPWGVERGTTVLETPAHHDLPVVGTIADQERANHFIPPFILFPGERIQVETLGESVASTFPGAAPTICFTTNTIVTVRCGTNEYRVDLSKVSPVDRVYGIPTFFFMTMTDRLCQLFLDGVEATTLPPDVTFGQIEAFVFTHGAPPREIVIEATDPELLLIDAWNWPLSALQSVESFIDRHPLPIGAHVHPSRVQKLNYYDYRDRVFTIGGYPVEVLPDSKHFHRFKAGNHHRRFKKIIV